MEFVGLNLEVFVGFDIGVFVGGFMVDYLFN